MAKNARLDQMMDSITPANLAKISAFVSSLIGPDSDAMEFKALQDLSDAAFDAGNRNYGMDFVVTFFDEHERTGTARA